MSPMTAVPGIEAEGDGDTVVAGCQEGGGASPRQCQEGQQVSPDTGGVETFHETHLEVMGYLVTACPFSASATEMEQSCATHASLVPAELKDTACTQPPPIGELVNSAII